MMTSKGHMLPNRPPTRANAGASSFDGKNDGKGSWIGLKYIEN
jgi:hypothetical protein